jgi:hypothetical protein
MGISYKCWDPKGLLISIIRGITYYLSYAKTFLGNDTRSIVIIVEILKYVQVNQIEYLYNKCACRKLCLFDTSII